MTLLNRVTEALGINSQSAYARLSQLQMASSIQPASPVYLYRMLKAFYFSNGLYDILSQSLRLRGVASEALKPLRNPTYRVVEFYVSHVWPGNLPDALPIVTENKDIIPAIQQVWKWSNWSRRKQLAIRMLGMAGDSFIKVVQPVDRSQVYFQLIDAEHVVAFESDHRDFLTMIRVDTPQMGDNGRCWTYTEVWSKDRQDVRIWKHEQGDAPIDKLGDVAEIIPFKALGIDFVPFVHIKFRDVGDDRGMAAITPALEKIDEANRQATRLHQMLFRYNRPLWATSANANDKSGRPIPAPALDVANGTPLTLNEDTMLSLPGMAKIESLVPNVNYEHALLILQDMMGELENDLPELAYYSIRQIGQPSGRAIRLLLSDAIDRLLEVRGNAEAGLIQANEMALSMGAEALGIRGSFDNGDFEHSFAERDVIQIDDVERAQGELAQAQAAQAWQTAGLPLSEVLRRSGDYSEDQIARILNEAADAVAPAEVVPAVAR